MRGLIAGRAGMRHRATRGEGGRAHVLKRAMKRAMKRAFGERRPCRECSEREGRRVSGGEASRRHRMMSGARLSESCLVESCLVESCLVES